MITASFSSRKVLSLWKILVSKRSNVLSFSYFSKIDCFFIIISWETPFRISFLTRYIFTFLTRNFFLRLSVTTSQLHLFHQCSRFEGKFKNRLNRLSWQSQQQKFMNIHFLLLSLWLKTKMFLIFLIDANSDSFSSSSL